MHHLIGSLLLAQEEGFIGSTLFFIIMGVLLIGLIIVYFVIKNKKEED